MGLTFNEWCAQFWPDDPRCACTTTVLCRRVYSNDAIGYVYQCERCGRQVKQVRRSDPAVGRASELPSWNDDLAEQWQAQQTQAYRDRYAAWQAYQQQQRAEESAERSAAWWSKYNAYLQTPAWRAKRALVMDRAMGRCEGCGRARATQVHHLTYDHVGDELLFELVAVCDACHRRIHENRHAA